MIKGYLNRPDATAESITNGWLHTGDVARIDEDGFIFIVDRKKDMVLRGGENVYCAEVEATAYRHPAVAECCVFGVPDDRLGRRSAPRFCCVPATPSPPTNCAPTAPPWPPATRPPLRLVPRRSHPRNASGKFLKRALRESLKVEDAG
uniref:AMP-binding protein n=1 Tax=Phenylobacterium glaciei TaxID=2803784 RepID=A0A974S8V3_9CAUL|nr:AMP-binding protein [Phenylobacterium glaciei]